MLNSERNTETTKRNVVRAARSRFRGQISPVYEHGHWWIQVFDGDESDGETRTFDVVDANTPSGFDFEEV